MLETLLALFITGIVGLVAFLVIFARWHYGSLEKLRIPVVKPHFILGSDPDGHKTVYQEKDLERFQKYGPVFGVYEGRTPRVFVLDPEMIRRIMVKDFTEHFYDRNAPDWGHEIWDNLLDFLPGEKWKTVRSALTPMFTSSRIRNGSKMYVNLMDKYVNQLKKEMKGDSIKMDLKDFMTPVFVEFTSDYFLAIKLSAEGNIRENFVYKMVCESMGDGEEANFFYTLMTIYPFILKIFNVFSQEGVKKFLKTLDQVIATRRELKTPDSTKGKDFVDVMISMLDKLESPEYKQLGIEKITIQAQAFEMFIAGFDSIIGTLVILPYYLAMNMEAQEKVLEEIDQNYNFENSKKDDVVPELPYLTACIKEAIRLSPSFHRLERKCMKDWTYSDPEKGINVTIPEGMSVVIPAWATNRNPQAFTDPEKFVPERYYKNENGMDGIASKEDHNLIQYSMNSFGHGPRNCPGSRLGIEMIKAGISRILQEFKFECRDDTKVELLEGIPMITRYRPIYLNLVKRNEQ